MQMYSRVAIALIESNILEDIEQRREFIKKGMIIFIFNCINISIWIKFSFIFKQTCFKLCINAAYFVSFVHVKIHALAVKWKFCYFSTILQYENEANILFWFLLHKCNKLFANIINFINYKQFVLEKCDRTNKFNFYGRIIRRSINKNLFTHF